ncbi:cell surface protein [Bdellovibrio bacteriovorus]|uniref:Cell surface protein n=1 Tax=Bdellovibrio bacteriovorus TaxID=959 RepID=A0A162GFR6_BDEBC|nr:PKD domain-containing protein [Bdellovibrio bacteriovorus]KYG68040.1 cell surface protein [Bdellovibrio bacteriovorus]
MNRGMRLVATGLLLLSVGCQKAQESSEVMDLSSSTLTCKPGSQKVSTANLKIEGESVGQTNEAIQYKLNEQLSCDSAQEVVWKAAGGSSRTATSVTSVYKKAGTYVMTASVQDVSGTTSQEVSFKTVVVASEPVMIAPTVGVAGQPVTFDVGIPENMTLLDAYWTFGDGTPSVSSMDAIQHTYAQPGTYTVKVLVVGNPGGEKMLSQTIVISEEEDQVVCTAAAAISGPSEAKVGSPVSLSLYMPQCLADQVGAIRWAFGDGGSASGQNVQHTYAAEGTFEVSAVLLKGDTNQVLFNLKHSITVTKGTVDPEPEPTPEPEVPGSCQVKDQIRESQGDIYSETVACGLNGTKEISYRDVIKEQCQLSGEKLSWVEISRSKEVTNEGSCEGQSCRLPDGSVLPHGGSKVLYSTSTPAGSCASVSQERVCNNGVLSGSDTFNQNSCHNGCGDFGSHGTVKTDVVTGEVKVPLTCAFGETGFFDIFTEVSDQTCKDGQIVSSNTHQGSIKTPGACPTYKYVPTENFTACTADCGGKQSRIFVCVDDKGTQVGNERCAGQAMPVEERVCDGNPEAVRRQESSTSVEEANSSQTCPANQIGVIVNKRDVTKVSTYACIDHKVQLEGTETQYGPWVAESYCRDYVARRCSQDSLSNSQAQGRYEWMVKCQDQLPIIKEFLAQFDDVKVKSGKTSVALNSSGQHLYPTFMDRAYNPEKPWIAPTSKNAACTMPSTVYVATVCVSSCATPEQLILAQEAGNTDMKYVPFIEALTKNYAFVASLQSAQSMGSKAIQKTKVDQWVTELLDTEHDILLMRMKSGRSIKVTPNHPLVASNGFMQSAKDFKVGEDLVQLGGVLDEIVSITPMKYTGKVYNIFVQSTAIHHNILVLNGYLNGSAYFQNDGAKELNRSLFRKTLTRGAF